LSEAGRAGVLCIGAAHLDRRARLLAPPVPASSNPVTVAAGWGGVARNVAEGLARLGVPAALLSRLGGDAEADRLLAALASAGVDVSGVARGPEAATASYTAVLDPTGELVIGLADMAIYDGMDAAFFAAREDALRGHAAWFADANLPAAGLARLLAARPAGGFVAANTVSVAKAPRLAGLLGAIDLLFCNRAEAAALSGAGSDPATAAAALRAAGAGAVVVTLGADGALLATAAGAERLPAPPAAARDVTGAGDALIAATLQGWRVGLPPTEALRRGLAAAALTVACEQAVRPDLSPALLERATGPRAA
jgi:pseudouridine kinase